MKKLVLASKNRHKIVELRTFLKDLPFDVLAIEDLPNHPVLVEDGVTFEENALKKARVIHEHTKLLTLADDSGLEVFYRNGRPGVRSARYSGDGASDKSNNEKLLKEMRGVPPRRRRAQFRAVLALVGDGVEDLAVGVCPGVLAESPRGTNGFGYDPIFIPDGFVKTYAELSVEEKNRISHRSRAFANMRDILKKRA